MRSVIWRGPQRWRSDDEGAALNDVSTGQVDPAVHELLTALDAEPRPRELEGLAEPLAAYRATFAAPERVPTTARRALVLTGLLSAKAAAAAGGVALGLAATAMAVAVNLPETGADRVPVSPAATTSAPQPSVEGEGVGPDATGPAAHGLCTAWSNHVRNGNDAPMDSPPMRNLAEAAGGEAKIAAYCAAIPHPGKGPGSDKPGKNAGKDQTATGHGQDKPGKGADDDAAPGTPKPTATASPSSTPSASSPSPSATTPPTAQ